MSNEVPLAVLCNDIHLSHNPPAGRNCSRSEWYDLMASSLLVLAHLQDEHDVPVLCAGDLFDRWNSPPELINFAIRYIPKNFWCIPGQHDLPNHAYDQRHRSAYGCLEEAGIINPLVPGKTAHIMPGLRVYAFPWEHAIKPLAAADVAPGACNLAIVHQFIYGSKSTSYPGAPTTAKVSGMKKTLAGYDVAHFGDNHKQFTTKVGGCVVWNGGGFMQRKRDEHARGMQPYAALLMLKRDNPRNEAYYVEPVELPTAGHWLEAPRASPAKLDAAEFIDDLQTLWDGGVDYRSAVERHIAENPLTPEAKSILMEALDEHR